MQASEDLLLFRAVDAGGRRAMALRLLLGDPAGSPGWRLDREPDLWELHDATLGAEDQPAAVASTRPLGEGRRVRLTGLAVSDSDRAQTTAQRMVEELVHALRARGAHALVAVVPAGAVDAKEVLERAGLRRVDGRSTDGDGDDADGVWFDVEL